MIGDSLTALLFGVGLGTWVFSKLTKTTHTVKDSLVTAGVVGIVGFIVLFTLLKYLLSW